MSIVLKCWTSKSKDLFDVKVKKGYLQFLLFFNYVYQTKLFVCMYAYQL